MIVIGTSSNGGSQESAFYSNSNTSKSISVKTSFRGRHGSSHGGHHQHEGQSHGSGRETFRGIGSCDGRHQGQQLNSDSNCYYCKKPGHMANNCYQKEHDARNGKL
jgi:hypothetical protein